MPPSSPLVFLGVIALGLRVLLQLLAGWTFRGGVALAEKKPCSWAHVASAAPTAVTPFTGPALGWLTPAGKRSVSTGIQ